MKRIAIIPARGGSKRIPRKNIKLFLGKPIIAYSIEAALMSNLFDKVIVSTDDKEIAEIALKFGAKVPFLRSQNTSNDFSSTFDVIEEVSKDLKALNEVFDYTCCIYPCAPFTSIENLLLSYNLLIKNKFDSVFPPPKSQVRVQSDTPTQPKLWWGNQAPRWLHSRAQTCGLSTENGGGSRRCAGSTSGLCLARERERRTSEPARKEGREDRRYQ